jgi:tungstate transport system substrate-binding protein
MLKILYFIFFIILMPINGLSESLIIQSTTSTRDSGLYKYLLPKYPYYSDIKIKVIAVGTGQAIKNAENCDGNILIVHDKDRELEFMSKGFGVMRHELMYNDYVLIGPTNDNEISKSNSITNAFSRIYDKKYSFISRSDSSGTHSAELAIWSKLSLYPRADSGKWYLESGQGMGPSLNIAVALDGYIFSDRSSWLRFKNKRRHKILYENRRELKNNYGMILVNHDRCSNLNYKYALDLYNWLSSDVAAGYIKKYRLNNERVFYID